MAESVPDVQTTSQEDSAELTSSDQTENSFEEETKTFPTFGFDVKNQKTDLALTFGKHILYVKKSLLEDASSVFEELFQQKLSGKTVQEVEIEGVSCEDFAEFLACIQRRGKRQITQENVYKMLEIASKYEVEDLMERCGLCLQYILDEEKQDQKSVLRLLHLANENNLQHLKYMCLERTDWTILDALQEKDKGFNLSPSLKSDLEGQFIPVVLSNSYITEFLQTSLSPASSRVNIAKILYFGDAKGFMTDCNVSTEPYKKAFKLWDVSWNLEVGKRVPAVGKRNVVLGKKVNHYTFYPWFITLQVNQDINSTKSIKIAISCKIFNYMPKKYCSTFKTFTFEEIKNGISWNSVNDMDIGETELRDENRGFSDDGYFKIEVYILMTKPESASL